MVQEELVAFAKAAGLALDKANNGQALAGARILFAAAERGVAPYSATLAKLIGGYPLNAIVCDPALPGVFWVSSQDKNFSTPGAKDAAWQSLFNGYATKEWAGENFVANVGGNMGGIVKAAIDSSGTPSFCSGDGQWFPVQLKGDYATSDDLNKIPTFSDFMSGWGQNGYVELPTQGNWKTVIQWVQFQGVTGPGGNNGAGLYETEDIFVTWPLGMANLFSVSGLAVEDVGGTGMQESVWKGVNTTSTGGSFRMSCMASGITMRGSAIIVGGVAV